VVTDTSTRRWAARPVQAAVVRGLVFVVPIAGSIVFVHFASRLIAVPTGSFVLFISWWVLMSAAATVVLVAIDRVTRRLLPLVALYKLSLVFPDAAPSRFRMALRTGTTHSLQERIAARPTDRGSTPVEAAQRVLALVAELDDHDSLTRGHSERVRAYAQMIGREMHLGSDELDLLNWAALLHDIGKLGVPSEILTKPGPPTEQEWDVLRRHPEIGESLVAPLRGWLADWADAVGQHHEHWDGRGYPRGISREEIGLSARIVAVADAFDVITSSRSYKTGFSSAAAREEIAESAATQFDPRVVRAFLNISLGRLRLVMGPLSWLAHAPILARIPLTPALGTAAGALATVAAAVSAGVIATPPEPALATTAQPVHHAMETVGPTRRVMRANESILIRPGAGAPGAAAALRITGVPRVGRARVVDNRRILYAAPAGFSGTVEIGYLACTAARSCVRGVVIITVLPRNDPPTARADRATTRQGHPVSIDVLANDSDPNDDPLSIARVFDVGPGTARIVARHVQWTPPQRFSGTSTFHYAAADGSGGSDSAKVTITVKPSPARSLGRPETSAAAPPPAPAKNHPPRAVDDPVSVPEAGTVTLDVLANDSDPDGDLLALKSLGDPSQGAASIVDGRMRFVAPADYVGRVTIAYTIVDTSDAPASARVLIDVLPVNSPPSFAAGADQAVLEDAGAQTASGWATDISPGPPGESGQQVSFSATATNGGLFSPDGQPAVTADGTLTYTSAPNANGNATIKVRATDSGGSAYGGDDTSAPHTFTITITPVNDPPSFTAGADQTVLEDAGAQSAPGWATAISPGPPDESGQHVNFLATSTNAGLFSPGGQPALTDDGTLTYTPAPNVNGSATVTVRATDNGGSANGGNDTSAPRAFAITVTPVNDPPVAVADSATVAEDDSAGVTVDVLANDIDPDAGAVLSLASYDDSTIADGTVVHNGGGSFTYVPDPGFFGSDTFSYTVSDGTGGSSTAAVTITVTPVAHAPLAASDAYATAQDTPLHITAPGLLANDSDQDGDALAVVTTPAAAPTSGTLVLASDGSFDYTPNSGFTGADTFTYTVADATGRSATATATITVNSTVSLLTLFFHPTGVTFGTFDLLTTPPPAAAEFADLGGDGNPGLTIKQSTGGATITDPTKVLSWIYDVPASPPLDLNGPVTLQLWSAIGPFGAPTAGHIYAYLSDCDAGGTVCTTIASANVFSSPWNTDPLTWSFRTITIGSFTGTIAPAHKLRIKLLFSGHDLWVTTTDAFRSSIVLTVG
jgi:HD-GYP domain-containing protein (c-di-GMP phosphodiesterase class II)